MVTSSKAGLAAKVRALRKALASEKAAKGKLESEFSGALARQTATAEILEVIRRSPADAQPVFDAIARCAAPLFSPCDVSIHMIEGERIALRAAAGPRFARQRIDKLAPLYPLSAEPEAGSLARVIAGKRVAEVPDTEAPGVNPRVAKIARTGKFRWILSVPLLREDEGIGAISLSHPRPRFKLSAGQRSLLQTFADQAAIAIENVRLFNETKEALESQTATAEILKVISRSPTDIQPVLDAVAEYAARLCGATDAIIRRVDPDGIRLVAHYGPVPITVSVHPVSPGSVGGRAVLECRTVHVHDILDPRAYAEYPDAPALRRDFGIRTIVAVPLLRENKAIGVIVIRRREARAFADKQIALLATFADQAAIAIENVRLFNETKEALERQTATAEILKVISSSPTDLQPVFDAILENATRLCEAQLGILYSYDGSAYHVLDMLGSTPEYEQFLRRGPIRPGPKTALGRVAAELRPVQIEDVRADAAFTEGDPLRQATAKLEGTRTLLMVPMLKERRLIGALTVYRREVRMFSEKQMALLLTFADQAAIAIENVRLFNETREALERQTATAEVLKVIAASPSDVQPVFDAIARSARELIGGRSALVVRRVDDTLHLAAHTARSESGDEALKKLFPTPLAGQGAMGKAILSASPVCVADVETDAAYSDAFREGARARGIRSMVVVPMMREGGAIGGIAVSRAEPGPFTDHQIDLLKTFTDQAVIAIENVRLFNETTEALERQTATAEILKVIAGSPSNVQPVFDAIVESGCRLFSPRSVGIVMRETDKLALRAMAGPLALGAKLEEVQKLFPLPFDREFGIARAIADRTVIAVSDAQGPGAPEAAMRIAKLIGYRSLTMVPLLREGVGVGAIVLVHSDAGYTLGGKQLELVKTFADQAVIAIENVRLFRELEARNRDVTEALEQQTATAEILRVISSSPTDTQPVFDAIAASALRLFGGLYVAVVLVRGERIDIASAEGRPEIVSRVKGAFPVPLDRESITGSVILDRTVRNIPDTAASELPEFARNLAGSAGVSAILGAPMLREGAAIGAIMLFRENTGEFSTKQVSLLETFADQAVIAIENVRLFNETKEALEQQTAISEVLRVISGSPTDVRPVLDAVAMRAAKICEAPDAHIFLVDGKSLRHRAEVVGDVPAATPMGEAMPLDRESVTGRAVVDRSVVHVRDILAEPPDEFPASRAFAERTGFRTGLSVPLMREDHALGAISLRRFEVRPFTDRQVTLLRTFADQAAIAIENVRLFNETREALERQTATAEILKVIASSPSDVQPVFDAIARSAARLIGGRSAVVARRVGDALHLAALTETTERGDDALRKAFPTPLAGQAPLDRAVITGRPAYATDTETDATVPPKFRESARLRGTRSIVAVPMLREGGSIGGIAVNRPEPGTFTDQHIGLLQAFADQAVIAIENVRLFNETKEALERQTATAEILKVIASSPSDGQPVFEAIVNSAARLVDPCNAVVVIRDGDRVRRAAIAGPRRSEVDLARLNRELPIEFDPARSVAVQAMVENRMIEVADTEAPEVSDFVRTVARTAGHRSITSVPLDRKGSAVGAIVLTNPQAGFRLTEKQLAQVRTFADQAVIAIENVRLFNETREALERQTATAEILKVIARSPSDVQPVFDAIVRSAVRLVGGYSCVVTRIAEGVGHLAAYTSIDAASDEALKRLYPMQLRPNLLMGIVTHTRAPQFSVDLQSDPRISDQYREIARERGYRSVLLVPMLRDDTVIGVIAVTHREAGPFSDHHVSLLKTFADQAVIAIENVRLFKELQSRTEALTRSVSQLTALSEVGQAISSTLDLETVLKTIVVRAVQLTGLDAGVIYEYDEAGEAFQVRASENFDEASVAGLRTAQIRRGEGAIGRAVMTREPTQVPDTHHPDYPVRLRGLLDQQGFRAILAVPLVREEHVIGALMVIRRAPGEFAPETVELLKTFATQSALAIQNARLFREIAEKGRLLEVASRHKSDFLASMSHELRTPLNAILGFNEMILGEIYGAVPPDMKDPLADIQASGKHLLRLINNVLDLAKIEAGRMELALSDYSVHDTVESVRSTLRPLAADKGLEFAAEVPQDIPLGYGDPGRITQCLMNLAGNALKFTKEGRVEISVALHGEKLVYRVADTGIGIPPDKLETVFAEFRQSDATIASEYGGTGLGLSISRKFVEMHGGRIWVESELGKGSAFLFEIPLRANPGAAA